MSSPALPEWMPSPESVAKLRQEYAELGLTRPRSGSRGTPTVSREGFCLCSRGGRVPVVCREGRWMRCLFCGHEPTHREGFERKVASLKSIAGERRSDVARRLAQERELSDRAMRQVEPDRERKTYQRVCTECGLSFESIRADAAKCSKRCRKRAEKRRARARQREARLAA